MSKMTFENSQVSNTKIFLTYCNILLCIFSSIQILVNPYSDAEHYKYLMSYIIYGILKYS